MNREKFVSFIKKYHLDGLVNSAILTFKDSKLSTRFTNGDKSILGMIELDNWDFEPGDFGVYDAGVFVKLIEVFAPLTTPVSERTKDNFVSASEPLILVNLWLNK